MKNKKITATFKGQDGSLGYKTGKEYKLDISHQHGENISISDESDSAENCEYSSVITFLNNWDNIHENVVEVENKKEEAF